MTEYTTQNAGDTTDEPRAVQLIFSYRGDQIALVEAHRVTMFVPPSDALEDRGPRSGFWVELCDAGGRAIFRQRMHHPITSDFEVFPLDPHDEIFRHPVKVREGAFSVAIPELRQARTLCLVASPIVAEKRCDAAKDVARFEMADVMRCAEGGGKA